MSPYLFIIVLELLLIKIRSDPHIKGIKFGNVEVKLAAFADDLTTFVHDKVSIEHLFSTLGLFEKCSGLKLNKDKTEAYWLGSSHNCKQNLGIETVNEPMKILGIYFTYNSRLKHELNFDAILKSLKKTLSGWQWRNLTVFGKIQIIKTFAMPKLMFCASVLNPDKDFLKKINSVMFNFLWNGKDKIKRLALISEYKDGGLKMPHVESAIKTQRIICLKSTLRTIIALGNLFSHGFLKIMAINSFFIVIIMLLIFPNTFLDFIASVLRPGQQSILDK